MLSYTLRDLLRNPRRTLASVVGVALAVGLFSGIAFFVDSSAATMTAHAIAPVAIDMQADVTDPLGTQAAGAAATAAPTPPVNLAALQSQVAALPGVSSVDRLGILDLPAGAATAGTSTLDAPLRIFAFDPTFLAHYPIVQVQSGSLDAASAMLSPDAARALGVAIGGSVSVAIPGRPALLPLPVSAIADFSHADPLFASRSADTQGEFVGIPNVLVVSTALWDHTILPSLRADAAAAAPSLKTAPVQELDVQLDRRRLAVDPTTAVIRTQGIRRSIERLVPGQLTVIDNLTDALNGAKGDAILAKVLFIFLGLPGVLLAAYLSRYAGSLLAQGQRRERAALRARGAGPAQLLQVLTYNTVAVGIIGSILGLALGFGTLLMLFGRTALTTAAPETFLLSIGLSLAAGLLTTALALYLPGRRALTREVAQESREMDAQPAVPAWLRLRLDLAFLLAAAIVGSITYLAGGYRPTSSEGQSLSLSFYVLLAPLLGWVGATLLGVRLFLALVNRLPDRRRDRFGGLTRGTLMRSLRRRSQALASGMIAISLAVAFGVSLSLFVTTYQTEKLADARFTIGSDLRVTPSVLAAQPPGFGSTLQVAGVSAVSPVSGATALVGTDKRAMAIVDPVTFTRVASLPDSFFIGISASAALNGLVADPSGILVSDELARTFNVQVGDPVNIQLRTAAGKPVPVAFRAVGRFKNFPGYPQGIDLVATRSAFQAATHRTTAEFFLLRAAQADDASLARIAAALQSGPGRTVPLRVETTTTAVNRDQSTLASLNLRGLGNLESVFTVLMSAAGMAIFIFGLLLQRRKEYVTMRALGMPMSSVRALLLGEAGTVTVVSLVLGALVGAGMALLFVQILTPLFTIPPSSISVPAGELALLAGAVVGATAAAVLAAGTTIRRLSLVELLREE
ncbi:MAG TPA: FtsX-like permease family protein [Candidatus Limnocylindrales bacterium]|nr:FtsX-like permease family protein [Candidatus Limnocylindrales bacterium]